MKVICKYLLIFAVLSVDSGNIASAQQNVQLATNPQAKITAKIIGEDGNPIEAADVSIGFIVGLPPGQGPGTRELSHNGTTGSDGVFTATDQSGIGVGLGVRKSAYYRTYAPLYFFRDVKNNQWQPWNPTVEMILKPIVKPIAMYARRVDTATIPVIGQPVGFDLVESDWVAPYGNGKVADFIFTLENQYTSVDQPFDVTLKVRFSNEDDGIQSVFAPINVGSELRLPRSAPEDGYQSELVKSNSRKSAADMIQRDYRDDQNYFFRVRAVKKDKKIVSAYYGKIDRDIEFWGNEKLRFTYYLNPTPNDRNMEFDPKRNLLKGLKDAETVSNP